MAALTELEKIHPAPDQQPTADRIAAVLAEHVGQPIWCRCGAPTESHAQTPTQERRALRLVLTVACIFVVVFLGAAAAIHTLMAQIAASP
jgi:hypothetical protein